MEINQNEIAHRVPLTTAMQNVANYKEFMRSLYKKSDAGFVAAFDETHPFPKAFTIEHADLLQLFGFPDPTDFPAADHFRIYLGLTTPDSGNPSGFKTYCVPLRANENGDNSEIFPVGEVIVDGVIVSGVQYVYDFSLPCPNTCDRQSYLFQAGE